MMDFEMILKLPQAELKEALQKELQSAGYTVTSKDGFLYAPGTVPVLLVAHLDTVHEKAPSIICYSKDNRVLMSPQGIGGDDRAGVYMILEIIKQANCHVLFCEDEEIGDIGAKKFVKSNMPLPVYYIIELDRQGHNDAVYYWNLLSNVCVTFSHSMVESSQVKKLIAKGRQCQCLTILYT